MMFRDYQEAICARRTDRDKGRDHYKPLNSILNSAGPLIAFMRRHEPYFRRLGDKVEQRLKDFRHEFLKPVAPCHRHGEPWVRNPAEELIRLFWTHGVKKKRTITAVHRIFVFAAHKDVVTTEMIRHISRRLKDPPQAKRPR